MIKEYLSKSVEETTKIAMGLGKQALPGDVFGLIGELGSGKTIIAKAIAKSLNITEDITSPTFTLMEVYQGKIPYYHFDLYRIEDDNELDHLFFEEYWEGKGISVIEWADRALKRLPENTVFINIDFVDEDSRRIRIEYPDN